MDKKAGGGAVLCVVTNIYLLMKYKCYVIIFVGHLLCFLKDLW